MNPNASRLFGAIAALRTSTSSFVSWARNLEAQFRIEVGSSRLRGTWRSSTSVALDRDELGSSEPYLD